MKDSTIHFDYYENPSQSVVNNGAKYHIRIHDNTQINLDDIGDRLLQTSTATKIDIAAVVTGIREVMVDELSKGNVITIDGICKIEPILGVADGMCKGTEKGNMVQLKTLRMHPVKSLVEDVKVGLKSCTRIHGQHSSSISIAEVYEWLVGFFTTHKFITRYQLEKELGLTHYMASKYLKSFVQDGKLIRPGRQNDSLYMPVAGSFEKSNDKF